MALQQWHTFFTNISTGLAFGDNHDMVCIMLLLEMRLFYFYASQMTSIEESYLLYREGLLEEEYVTGRARGALSPLDSPSGHRYLQVNGEGGRFSKDFMDWIYAIIDAGEAIQLPDSADR